MQSTILNCLNHITITKQEHKKKSSKNKNDMIMIEAIYCSNPVTDIQLVF